MLTEIRSDSIQKIRTDPFYSFFRDINDSVLVYAFDNAVSEIPNGLRACLESLNPYSDSVVFYTNLLCHYLLGYTLKPYLKEDPSNPGKWIIEDRGSLPDLFRTVGSQSADGLSISFESERLGIGINNPFDQWLSTTSFGFRCIQPTKLCALRKGRVFIS